jgi:hypothetical protein
MFCGWNNSPGVAYFKAGFNTELAVVYPIFRALKVRSLLSKNAPTFSSGARKGSLVKSKRCFTEIPAVTALSSRFEKNLPSWLGVTVLGIINEA